MKFVSIAFLGVFSSTAVFAQSPAEDTQIIKYKTTKGVVCETGKDSSGAKKSLNTTLNGNAITTDGRKGVAVGMDGDQYGIVVPPFSVSSPSIAIDPLGKSDDYRFTICVVVQSGAAAIAGH